MVVAATTGARRAQLLGLRALYPHMSVYDNVGFALKLAKVPKGEIDERVRRAADVLELTEYLDRKPGQLSGGQRQRVAMGRPIVRQPAAFLMDEPLSNLDAKLRVLMRAEIASIQRSLGVTTFYVTHDQVEALTMGDRVAVIKDGHLQQVDTPRRSMTGRAADHPRLQGPVALLESLGSEMMVHVELDATTVDSGDSDAAEEAGAANAIGRFNPRSTVRPATSWRSP